MKLLNLGCGPDIRDGFDNLDATRVPSWRFEDGLGQYEDGSVDGITVGCALYCVPEEKWRFLFDEFARVLRPGGVVRITEPDATNLPPSDTVAWANVQTYTTPGLVGWALLVAGLAPFHVDPGESHFSDPAVLENGRVPPRVFITEGVKP